MRHRDAAYLLTEREQEWLRDRCLTIHDVMQDAIDRHAALRHGIADALRTALDAEAPEK